MSSTPGDEEATGGVKTYAYANVSSFITATLCMRTVCVQLSQVRGTEKRATWGGWYGTEQLSVNVWETVKISPYLLSMWKFCDKSAARLAVGEDPRTGFKAK
jgi:hypothetical protein